MSDKSAKILLVDDNVVNQKVAIVLLHQWGLEVDVVNSGQRAIQSVEKELYSMILMDCQMPGMDGFETTKAIRKLESLRGSYTPIIALTALAMVGDKERCIAVGMDDYISKPIDRQMLKIKLNHWLQKEVVMKNQELASKFATSNLLSSTDEPLDLSELKDYYGDELNDVLTTFIESGETFLKDINQAVFERKDDKLAYLAHELKGSSASVGARALAKFCVLLERAAGLKDWLDVRETVGSMTTAFNLIKEYVREQNLGSHEEVILPRIP